MWAKPTNTLSLCKILIAKQQAVWRLERNGVSLLIAIATRKAIRCIMKKLIISYLKGCHMFCQTLLYHTNSVAVCVLQIAMETAFLGRCPSPRAFKKARPKFFVIYPKLSAKQ